MKLTSGRKERIAAESEALEIKYLRIFGSALRDLASARDVDIVVDRSVDSFDKHTRLTGGLEAIFGKPIDLVILKPGLEPALVEVIGLESQPLYENPEDGRENYAIDIDRYLAIAQDEILSFSDEDRRKSRASVRKRLRVP